MKSAVNKKLYLFTKSLPFCLPVNKLVFNSLYGLVNKVNFFLYIYNNIHIINSCVYILKYYKARCIKISLLCLLFGITRSYTIIYPVNFLFTSFYNVLIYSIKQSKHVYQICLPNSDRMMYNHN